MRIGLVLLLGLLTTILIAWTGAYFERANNAPSICETLVYDTFTARCFFQQGFTITRIGTDWEDNPQLASINPSWIDVRTRRSLAHAPSWSAAWLTTRPKRPPGTWGNWPHEATLEEFAAGWPFRALHCDGDEAVQDPVSKVAVYSFRRGIDLRCHIIKRPRFDAYLPRALPCRPLALGFTADTAIFAALWSLIVLRGPAIRAFRRRRGLCPACGYDLTGNTTGVCPECGRMGQAMQRDSETAKQGKRG